MLKTCLLGLLAFLIATGLAHPNTAEAGFKAAMEKARDGT